MRTFRRLTFLILVSVVCSFGALASEDGAKEPYKGLSFDWGQQKLRVFGYGQTQFNVSESNETYDNRFEITRFILMADAQLYERLSFWLMVDLGSTASDKYLHEYYAQYTFCDQLKVRMGQFKIPFMLENLLSPTSIGKVNFNEVSLYEAGIAMDPLMGVSIARDAGVMLTGDAVKMADGHPLLNYSLGLFNGTGMNIKENNKYKDVIGMLNVMPVKGLTLSGSFMIGKGHALADDNWSEIEQGEDYKRQRGSLGAEWKSRPLTLRSEWVCGRNGDITNQGFYAEAWVKLYKGLDLVLDYEFLDKNIAWNKSRQAQCAVFTETNNYLVGLQYWLWNRCRISSQFIFNDRRTGLDSRQWVNQFQIVF